MLLLFWVGISKCGYNLNSLKEIDVLYGIWSICFLCEIFGRELWFEKKRLVVLWFSDLGFE